MIRITKNPGNIPAVLLKNGVAINAINCQLTNTQRKNINFDNGIYGHQSVKTELKKIQNNKCSFCESRVSHVSHGDIEHFRPKAGWKQNDNDKLTKPGYYWLAYDYNNLFFACQICNQKNKKNFFPLSDPSKRALIHTDSIARERPLLINPGIEDPEKFITFNKEIAVPVRSSIKGKESIKRYGLNRKEVVAERFEFLETLEVLADLIRKNLPGSARARAHFKKISQANRIYSLMVRANFPDLV